MPETFDYQSFQKNKFVLAYKQIGPPREKFHPGTKCDEEFANASQVADRGTGTKKRKAGGLSRDRVREANAKKHKEALVEAVVERGSGIAGAADVSDRQKSRDTEISQKSRVPRTQTHATDDGIFQINFQSSYED